MASNPKILPDFWNAYKASFKSGLPKSVSETSFVVLDTETTGFDFKKDRILSIGALKIQNGVIKAKEAFEVFLKQTTFDAKTVEIHGILRKDKVEQISELEGLEILLLLLENSVLVAHHTRFDVGMLNTALTRNGLPKLINPELDTSRLFHRSLRKSKRNSNGHYSLDELSEHFNIPQTDRHTALGDAYITAIAFLHILEKLKPVSLEQLFKHNRSWEFWK